MTSSADQPRRKGRNSWAALLAAALACAIAAPVLAMKGDLTSLIAITIALASGGTAWFATARLRPWSRTTAWAMLVVVAIAFVSSMGMKSLWLSVHGEPANGCVVTKESSHTPRRSPTYFWNELSCGSSQITYRPSPGHSAKKVGERIDLVVDPTGLAGYAEPDTIKPWVSALVGLATAAGVVHVGLVLWWPARRREKKAAKPEVDRGFL
ncbi:hypothetical protein SK571_29735 [Lentzea sp. BCCO 10_0798]|uniref:Uncharacterized protein n=1 Tax=Lentzea kristufekii TaxID=3095430 RepID=A0ABU4TZ32_9PSEU|nr:hypothetical protein [Lentzea sp. BCCO 10_0798]MDX8053573.1 hypothetical protein [Lentzea sp. BCCO 10_0798]